MVAQAHLENKGVQLFLWADTEDRASRFNKYVFFNGAVNRMLSYNISQTLFHNGGAGECVIVEDNLFVDSMK